MFVAPLSTICWILVVALGGLLVGGSAAADDSVDASRFLEQWCVECHGGPKPKGKLDFAPIAGRLAADKLTPADRSILREAAALLRTGEMPPPEAERRPSLDAATAAADWLAQALRVTGGLIAPPGGPPRRLNRHEYANAVLDLLGVDLPALGSLPPDDIGAGFDNIGSVLSLSPGALERHVELAEAIAAVACPEADSATAQRTAFDLATAKFSTQYGSRSAHGIGLFSSGAVAFDATLPREGIYAVDLELAPQQAGPEPVKVAVVVDGKPLAYFDIAEPTETVAKRTAELTIPGGPHAIGVAFLNDYYTKDGGDGHPRDRNLVVRGIALRGPVDRRGVPAWRAAIAERSEQEETRWLVEAFLRRAPTGADEALLAQVCGTLPASATREARVRAMLTALLAHPEFLFRVERDPPAGSADRELDGYEYAARLAAFLWSSVPDAMLREAAASGDFEHESDRVAIISHMLDDPRASRLATRFAPQWLRIDSLESKTPDPARYPTVKPALLSSMRVESILFFDSVLRENRPATTLLDADYTFVDEPLARHYGLPTAVTGGMQRVGTDPARGGGVLAHASVLTATSNPTRTSPVKRGKWVLEAILNDPPPPPKPGVPQLPAEAELANTRTMREMMERHRADPECAACHRRMDALGFALEGWDAVGRPRIATADNPIDERGDLPDGRSISGLSGLRDALTRDPAFIRSLVVHLLTFATGRELGELDESIIDDLVARVGPTPTLRALVIAVADSTAMRRRGAP